MAHDSKHWIISVGVNSSKHHEQLRCSHSDAIDMFKIISTNWDCGLHDKILLIGDQATTKNINIAVNEVLKRKANEKDYVFIYISGHIDRRSLTGLFVTYDYCEKDGNLGLNLRSLRYLVEDSKAKYIIVIIDGCFSGVITQEKKHNTPHWFYFTTGEMESEASTKLFITAGSSGKRAYEDKDKKNSEFTRILLNTISPFVKNRKSLSTSLFYEILVKKSKKDNIYPVRSGIEIGYTDFIKNKTNEVNIEYLSSSEEEGSYIPEWVLDIFSICENADDPTIRDESFFVRDNNFADGSKLLTGEVIKKSWRIRNAGNVSWKNRFLKIHGQPRGTGRIHCDSITSIPDAEPNQEIDIEVELKMPPYPCSVYAEFKMTDSSGRVLFPNKRGLYVAFDVIYKDNLEIPSSEKEERCFIVKDVYGDSYSSEVKILSSFKDNILIKNKICTKMVSVYYSDFGKKIASFVRVYFSFIIPIARKFLNGLICLLVKFWVIKPKETKRINK
jgi:hypothetical protein